MGDCCDLLLICRLLLPLLPPPLPPSHHLSDGSLQATCSHKWMAPSPSTVLGSGAPWLGSVRRPRPGLAAMTSTVGHKNTHTRTSDSMPLYCGSLLVRAGVHAAAAECQHKPHSTAAAAQPMHWQLVEVLLCMPGSRLTCGTRRQHHRLLTSQAAPGQHAHAAPPHVLPCQRCLVKRSTPAVADILREELGACPGGGRRCNGSEGEAGWVTWNKEGNISSSRLQTSDIGAHSHSYPTQMCPTLEYILHHQHLGAKPKHTQTALVWLKPCPALRTAPLASRSTPCNHHICTGGQLTCY
jgi:hypothetical protein